MPFRTSDCVPCRSLASNCAREDVCGQQHVTCKLPSASALACCGLQAPISDCRPPVALQFHEWPTFARRTPPTTILALFSPHYCLHTHAPSPSASASASRIISTACSFPHRPCPVLAQGSFSLRRALRCDHPLTFFSPKHPQLLSILLQLCALLARDTEPDRP
jgi:hypothetical protein